MCPVCLATAAVIYSSATGGTGLTAFVAHRIFRRKARSPRNPIPKEANHVNRNTRIESAPGGPTRRVG
jgi:hypothetical protein